MISTIRLVFLALVALVGLPACAQLEKQQLEKQNYHHNEWTKGRFSEVVTVSGPGKWVFLAGVGAEAEKDGSILHVGDFAGQCQYAYEKIGRLLAAHGGKMSDVVKLVTYVTSIKDRDAMNKCRGEAFKGGPLPVHTFLVISELARPGMVVEMDVVAVVPGSK
jgi:enamine deaminase RidA (YjgF/YER057c/UK114 family)